MKTSVIMPVHNREALVGSALRSLLRQKADAELDIVVVDDASTDGTAAVVAAIAADEPAVRLVRQDKANIARTRNTGLAHMAADSELVMFLDSDDIALPGRFAAEIPLFRADPGLDMTYSFMALSDQIDDERLMPAEGADMATVRGIHLSSAVFRRRLIDAVGGFNEALTQSEDWDYLLRLFERRPNYRLLDRVAFIYRRHPGNITRDRAQVERDFKHALLMSAQRRRRDPGLGGIPQFFDMKALFEERYARFR